MDIDYTNLPSNNPSSADYKQEKLSTPGNNNAEKPRQKAQFNLAPQKPKSKFQQIFLSAGDVNKAKEYLKNEAWPGLKYFLFSNITRAIETFLFKEVRYNKPQAGYARVIPYDYTKPATQQQKASPVSSALRFDFSDIVFANRTDAVDCLHKMDDIISEYGSVSVGDLLDLVGRTPNKTDWTYVWSDLSTASTREIMGGCILLLPEPRPLN